MTCDAARIALGAFVLGALEPPERSEIDRHLRRCAECRTELAELAPLPGLLGRLSVSEAETLTADDLTAGELHAAPPPALLDRLLREAAAERRGNRPGARRRFRLTARRRLAVAAGVLLLAASVSVAVVVRHSSTAGSGVEATAADPATSVVVHTTARPRAWGTAVDVRLRGVAPGQRCRLVAVARDGQQDVAASWQATYEGEADVSGATAIAFPTLVSLRVVSDDGRVLATVPVHG